MCVCVCACVCADTSASNRLWSLEKSVSNLTESMGATQQLTKGNTPVFVPPVCAQGGRVDDSQVLLSDWSKICCSSVLDAAKDVHRLKFAVESNKDQLTSGKSDGPKNTNYTTMISTSIHSIVNDDDDNYGFIVCVHSLYMNVFLCVCVVQCRRH